MSQGQRRRVLLAAEGAERGELRRLFEGEALSAWEAVEADSLERARFLLQMDPCDVLLLGPGLYQGVAEGAGLAEQLAAANLRAHGVPVVLLVDGDAEAVLEALRGGAHYWLPRQTALRHPPVLALMLEQAADFGDLRRQGRQTAEALSDCRRQVSRLVSLLWEAVPGGGPARWFSQRHVLERLEEEVVRAQRYGGPLSVVLAEVEGPTAGPAAAGAARQVTAWTADRISQAKRRSDVAGQYGLQGFVLVLPQTTEAGAAGCCRRLRALLEKPGGAGPSGPLQVYFGIAAFSPDAPSVKGLLGRAEERLERARAGAAEGLGR